MSSSAQLELLFDSRETGAPEGVPPADAAPRATPGRAPRLTRRPRRVCRIRPRPLGRTAADAVPNASARVPTPCPDPLPPGARWREVNTDEQPIGFVLLRSRRRSIGFVITDDGLRVTAPNWSRWARSTTRCARKPAGS